MIFSAFVVILGALSVILSDIHTFAMNSQQLIDKQQRLKQAMREADRAAVKSGKAKLSDIAQANSCFAGVDLHKARSAKGFNLF